MLGAKRPGAKRPGPKSPVEENVLGAKRPVPKSPGAKRPGPINFQVRDLDLQAWVRWGWY